MLVYFLAVTIGFVLINVLAAGLFLLAGKVVLAFHLQDEWWAGWLAGLIALAVTIWLVLIGVKFIQKQRWQSRGRARE